MGSETVSLTYKWTANEGKGDELKAIYEAVGEHAKANEPDMLEYQCYEVEGSEDLIIHEVFRNAAAVGVHLQGTAAEFFPQLMAIATPGPFFFRGDLPDELKQALDGMNLGAVFATSPFGFSRSPSAPA